jgi:L-lysine epsilon oxidase-like protein
VAKIYKIHPGIGIARVGRSDKGYFLAPEILGGKPIELSQNGDAPFTGYKDSTHLMRRQGARFRVLEYDTDGGQETFVREITADDATIEWMVTLASRKAAGVLMDTDRIDDEGKQIVTPGTGFRNAPPSGFTRDDLSASVNLTAAGRNFVANPAPTANFLGKPFYIGEARTDAAGRLVVLGGLGVSETWTTPASPLTEFLNNEGWHDDIADGPVQAKITLTGASTPVDAKRAWVLTAPPDFAPDISPITTLYDVAEDAHLGPLVGTVSFTMDIEPLFQRFAGYFWINEAGKDFWQGMQELLSAPDTLTDNSAANRPNRTQVFEFFVEGIKTLNDFRLTKRQLDSLERWEAGTFVPGDDAARPATHLGHALDRGALTRGVGGGFFPGIEAGLLMRESTLYSELCRFTEESFTDFGGVQNTLTAGLLTSRMACPWQADFMECVHAWWPAQRPDVARFDRQGNAQLVQWDRGVRSGGSASNANRKNMVDRFARLGVIDPIEVQNQTVFAEIGRDPAL